MIARHRGDSRVHSRWSPSTPAVPPPPPAATEDDALPSHQPDDLLGREGNLDPPRSSQGKSRALIALATIVAIAVVAGQQHASAPVVPRLPSTPQQWVSHWSAVTLQNPAEVCGRLYAPALSRAFKSDTGRSCTSYYTSVKSTSFRIRHVLEDGPTAAVEAQEVGARRKRGYFTMLLSHVSGGWQAIDVVPRGLVRAR